MSDNKYFQDTEQSYSRVAAEYAEKFFGELAYKPLDRDLLNRFIREAGPLGPLCDMGCGPGQIARFLKDGGAEAIGMDLSAEMVAQAQKLNPGIPFQVGNMLMLNVPDTSWGGIAAFYSIIHIPRLQLPDVLREFFRVLLPGGKLLVAFHVGAETNHLDVWWDKPVSLDFNFLQPGDIRQYMENAGFIIEDVIIRAPYAEEHQSQRAYLFGRKP
jgi:ubiquinone/menaquinone biosynthesis C-methylase UbiE